VPGQVDEARPEAFFSIPSGEFVAGTLLTLSVVKNSGTAPKVNVFMSNGIMPTAQANQAAILGIDGGEIVVESTDLADNAPADSDGTLYIVLQAADAPTVTVAFSLEHTAGSLVPGLPDWALALIIVFAVLCCSIILAVVAFFIVKARNNRHSGKPKKDKKANSGIMMQQQHSQMWGGQTQTQMTSDYPSSQHQQMMMMQQQQMQQQQMQMQQMPTHQMQQSYGERSGGSSYPSHMGNTTQSQQYSGSYEDQFSRTSQQPLMNQQQQSQYHDDGMLPMW
jgi:hypothetical protein